MPRSKFIPPEPPSPEEINYLRKRGGLTMAAMAKLLEVSPSTVEGWCYGKSPMTAPIWRLFKLLARPLIKQREAPTKEQK